jgi:hypothetical protein
LLQRGWIHPAFDDAPFGPQDLQARHVPELVDRLGNG